MDKTNAARRLEARGIAYRLRVYDAGRAFHSADEAATLLGVPVDRVFKTLVVLREGPGRSRPLLVMVPADREVDLKRLARSIGAKKLRMATMKEAEALTGLEVGGISALALRPGAFEVFLDSAAAGLEQIHVSAGLRGVDLELAVADLARETGARWVHAITVDAARRVG